MHNVQAHPSAHPRPRIPPALIVAGALLTLIPIIGCMAFVWLQWAQLDQALPRFTLMLRVTLPLIGISLLCWAGAIALVGLYNRWAGRAAAYADKAVALTHAQRAFPDALHSLSYHDSHSTTAPAQLALAAPEAVLLAVPTFATMLDNGLVGPGRKLVLGYDEGGVMEGDWTDLYSTAVAGMPGQGKTTSQRFFACQTALHGARFAVIDPHAGAGADSLAATLAPLGSTFLCPIASDEKAMLDTVRYIADIGAQRVKGIDTGTTPIILWVDELTSLLGRSAIGPDLAELLERIAQEYRKKHVFVSASGQIWTASRTSSELRDSFASVICHRMKRGQARMLLPTDEAQLVERLSPGRAVLWRTSGATTVIGIPNTTEADVKRVAAMIGGQGAAPDPGIPAATQRLPFGFHPAAKTAPMPASHMPESSQNVAVSGAAYGQAQSGQTVSAEAQTALRLLLEGKDPAEIVLVLRKVKSGQGARYQQALKEIMELIRLAIQGGVK